jgi:hypothetical protein
MTRAILRAVALAICVAGIVDPAITRASRVKPDVGVVADTRLPDARLVDRVVRALEPHATVIRGAPIGAAAIVSVGYQVPGPSSQRAPVAFAVMPEPRAPFVSIVSAAGPRQAALHTRVPIVVRVQATAARGRTLTVTLERGGVPIDRVARPIAGDDATETIELGLVSAASGPASVAVTARIEGAPEPDRADYTVRLGDDRRAVLFFDRRPSWTSTFVRRALSQDPRFVVTSRVSTSRGASVAEGRPPAALASLPALELFDIVLVGAPEELTGADVSGLEAFLRERGGSVVLLMDVASAGRPFERLAGVTRWSRANRAEPAGDPLASEFLWPAEMPLWADPLAATPWPAAPPALPVAPPAIWRTAVGRGRLVVSGALDAWRYRDRNADGFDRFWRAVVAEMAASAPAAPAAPAPDAAPDTRDLLGPWTSSRGGQVIPESRLAALGPAIARALSPPSERRSRHPMRSAWWIVPFGLALGVEWWARRRAGRR